MSNEIVAYFKGRTGVAESVYQYDYGKVLIIDGLNLPATFEVHFAHSGDDNATTVIGQNNRVAIPNSYLTATGTVTAYIYLHDGDNDGETEYVVKFAVIQRARPAYDSTEEERSEFESAVQQAIAMLQNPKKINSPLDEHNQVTYGTNGQLLRTKGDGSTEWVDEGLPTDEQTAQAVSDWLDEHPEATTTVEDGSLTEAKFSDALKLKAIKDYVTPEMFGAYKDNIHDDAPSIQAALDFAEANNTAVFLNGYYYTQTSIRIGGEAAEGGKNITVYGESASIFYSGSDSAIKIQCINGADIYIGDVQTTTGNCIEFNSSVGRADRSQYVNLQFNHLIANSTSGCCIKISVANAGWSNQNIVKGGQMAGGKYGIYIKSAGQDTRYAINNWIFDNIGFEGTENNIYLDGSSERIQGLIFNNIRYAEFLDETQLFTLKGRVYDLIYNSRYEIKVSDISIDGSATLFNCVFNCPVVDENREGTIGFGYFASYAVRRILNYYSNDDKTIVEKNGTSYNNALTLTQYAEAGACALRVNNGIAILDIQGLKVNAASNDFVAEGGIPLAYRPKSSMNAVLTTSSGAVMLVWCRPNGSVAFAVGSVDITKAYFGQLVYYYN